ncbi:MAG: copper resistance protein CopC/CopD, partial [Thermoleophilia bacterium]|nr:copper resistance protein CopC/CopD [Thermoleophilia bacterium]
MRRAPATRPAIRMLLAWLLVSVALLLAPAVAGAHSRVLFSDPADKAVVPTAPQQLRLLFSANVTVQRGSIQVFDPDGRRVDSGPPATPGAATLVTQRLKAAARGTYGVSYRVSSEDGHVITGTLSFSVGASGAESDAARTATNDAAHVDRGLQAAFSTTRFIEVLALLVAAGGGLFACLIAPGWRPRWVIGALVVLLVSYASGYVLNAALAHGDGLAGAFDWDAIRASQDTPFALSVRIRALVAVVAIGPAFVLRAQADRLAPVARWLLAIVFAGLAASMSITGHAVTTSPIELRMPIDMMHVIAAAIWIGGLVQLPALAPVVHQHVDWIRRFSRAA